VLIREEKGGEGRRREEEGEKEKGPGGRENRPYVGFELLVWSLMVEGRREREGERRD
jgi:hypothetical protein